VPVKPYTDSEHLWQRIIRRAENRFKVVCWHRRARKTTMALNMLIESCCASRNETYGYIGPTYTQVKSIAVVDPMMMKRYLPKELCTKPFNESELRQEFVTGSVLEMKGGDNPDSIRGVGWKGVVLEEWAMMRHGRVIWEEILEPVLRENKGWAMFIFTPKGKNFAYEYFLRAKNDKTGDWLASYLPASTSKLIPADELAKARDSMPERLYKQEFECDFLEDATSVFRNVDNCVGGQLESPIPGQKYVLGIDLGRTNDYTALTVIRASTNHVVFWQRFTGIGWGTQKEKIVLAAKHYNNAMIVIDATGFSAGSVIAEDLLEIPLVKDLKIMNMQVVPFNFGGGAGKNKRALVEKLMVVLEQRLITFPKELDILLEELRAFTYETTDFGNIRYTAPDGLHDDCVMSLALAVFGLGSYVYAPMNRPQMVNRPRLQMADNI
jgi:hypothetical protein